ncbi:MAG: LysR family transcriptional regulator [Proteobacteria bacterium]|nr:LysR family transcriptional regulator [Pseudomonadota bacterium]
MLKNMPNTKVLQTFESAARLGSFTLAARELYVTQSAISRQIKGLEEILGFEVFTRINNRLELTEDGQAFYQVVSKALSDMSSALERLRRGEVRRRLFVALPPTFASRWFAPRLVRFRGQHTVSLTISIHENLHYSNFGNFDCQVGFGSEEMGTIGGEILFPEIVVPACTPQIKQTILDQDSLEGIPILHTLSGTSRLPYWEQWLDRCPNPIINPTTTDLSGGIDFSTQDQTIIAAVSGLGITMLDLNIASTALQEGLLETVGEPVNTSFGYWIFPPQSKRGEGDAAVLFYNWLKREATVNTVASEGK